jgi:hypothetical protein
MIESVLAFEAQVFFVVAKNGSCAECPASQFTNIIYAYVYIVLYGCETWSLTLREEHRLRAVENRVLRRILDQRGTK